MVGERCGMKEIASSSKQWLRATWGREEEAALEVRVGGNRQRKRKGRARDLLELKSGCEDTGRLPIQAFGHLHISLIRG
jgi:hypothetical protein